MVLLGKKIKELRNKHKYTQTVLADKLGVTLSSIAAYENNSRQPSYEVLIKMADVFKVSTDVFLLENSDKTNAIVSVEGLTFKQIEMIEAIVNDLRAGNLYQQIVENKTKE